MSLYVWFAVAMIVQVTVGRTQLLAGRGYVPDRSGLVASLIALASGLSFFALVVWGFATLTWYYVVLIVLVMGTISGFIVGRNSFAFWYQIRSLVDLVAVGLTAYLWWQYWPF